MNKLLTILFNIILINVIGFSQHYEPFISESKQWRYVQELYLTGDGAYYIVEKGFFSGDTILNDIKYSKYYKQQNQPDTDIERIAYFFREDTIEKKIYVYDFVFNKTALLYDFTLIKGDTFSIYLVNDLYMKQAVLDVDTFFTVNKKLKRIVFDDSTTWIEGFGCVTRTIIPSEGELICIKEDNSVLYINNKYNNCDTIFQQGYNNGTKDVNLDNSYNFIIFPNPITNSSVIRIKTNKYEKLKVEIYNCLGLLVVRDNFVENYNIGSINLTKGLYICKIINKKGIIGINKIIVK
jgi:hypothetical protein